MTKLLIKLFIKNSEDVTSPKVREAYGKLAGGVGIVSNVTLSLSKILVGFFFHSIAIMADGANNLADAGSSVITLVGFKLAGLPADEDHPYGHARFEYIAGLIVSILIIVLGVQLLRSSIDKTLHPDPLAFNYITLIVLVFAIGIKVWQSLFNYKIGEKISSSALKATGTDSRNDVIATSGVLLSIIFGKIFQIQTDGAMGVVVAAFVIYSGISLVKETVSPLLGEAPDQELVENIYKRIMSFEGVLGIHDLVVHEYGPGRCFASVHVEVCASEDILKSHDLIDNIERSIGDELQIHFVIHLDPVVTNDERITGLKNAVGSLVKEIGGELSMHDFRFVEGPTHCNLIFDIAKPVTMNLSDKELKTLLREKIKELDENYYAVITIDKIFH